jgi:predicted enzyme related to lactoylglutathione lyase
MLNFNSVLIGSDNPERLADFYRRIIGPAAMEDGGYFGFQVGAGFLTLGPHDKVHGRNAAPERILINFETKDVKGEFERIKGLGAEVIAEPYQMGADDDQYQGSIATFADPDGNYFQLMTPMDPNAQP